MKIPQLTPGLDPRGVPYPPYVNTDEERFRWDIATKGAVLQAAMFGDPPGSPASNKFVLFEQRAIYQLPLGEMSEEELAECNKLFDDVMAGRIVAPPAEGE
jgi:hypothetical protein